MEAVGGVPVGIGGRASVTLEHVDHRLYPVYTGLKAGSVALGAAPIGLTSSAVTYGLRALGVGAGQSHLSDAAHHAGLATDGVVRGLFAAGGILHGSLAAKAPWLVRSSHPTGALGHLFTGLYKAASYARIGVLGISGVFGAIRAAQAVQRAGSAEALLSTKDGRGGALQAIGSALLILPHPVFQLAGAGVSGAALINELFASDSSTSPRRTGTGAH